MSAAIFTGSYNADDVQILLKVIAVPDTSVQEKERQIQQEQRHYSEMLSHESLPSAQYIQLFHQAMQDNQMQMASDCLCLAQKIAERRKGEIVLVSLARAGTPVGVVLKHTLSQYFQRKVSHYSLSIIRDRGIDENALNYILARHADSSIVFVDGWTGKGVIARELKQSIEDFNQRHQCHIDSGLYVLVDLAGVAAVAASAEDYLIPSSILNATLSGLISRSVLNADYINAQDFHGCVFYQQFAEADLSQWFVAELLGCIAQLRLSTDHDPSAEIDCIALQQQSKAFIARIKQQYKISDENKIKPGIGEATRVLLRRVPDLVLLRDKDDMAVAHLSILAKEKQVTVLYQADLPYRAVSLIKDVS
ncbi:MAG: cysteine protease StiP family protein [Methylococcaceae bacterium]|nr:cysteine protease StiP family protein [Methylococcaceae bacterium]